MPAAILYWAALISLLPEGFAIRIDTKLDLPEPALISTERSYSEGSQLQIDSSLSPKIVKAFYEITFVPSVDNRLGGDNIKTDSGNNQLALTMPRQKCPFSALSTMCKLYFTSSQVAAVQQVEDLIQSTANKQSNDVPVVAGLVSPAEAASIVRNYDENISSKVNPKVKTNVPDVPVYGGTVDSPSVLRRPEQFYPCSSARPCSWRGPPF